MPCSVLEPLFISDFWVPRLQSRVRLPIYNTVDDAAELLRTRKNILILTGAGISTYTSRCFEFGHISRTYSFSILGVSCGIPDFRSRNGLYAMLQEKGQYDLSDPQEMSVRIT